MQQQQQQSNASRGLRVAFVVDTSASMNQRTVGGMRAIDVAKSAVEIFLLRLRARAAPPAADAPPPLQPPPQPQPQGPALPRVERFFLLGCDAAEDAPPRAGWADTFPSFLRALKALRATDMTSLGPATKRAFEQLNAFRLQSGADSYAQGRCPWLAEPAAVVLLTDGGAPTQPCASGGCDAVGEHFAVPRSAAPGADLTLEPFRWDQRVFALVLRFPGVAASSSASASSSGGDPVVAPMCEVTGGRCAVVASMKALSAAVDMLLARLQAGVVVNVEPFQQAPGSFPPCLHRMLLLPAQSQQQQQQQQLWPIPEAFFPEPMMAVPPPRSAQPTIKVVTTEADPRVPQGFPVDRYDLEPCALLPAMQANCKSGCWHAVIAGSGPGGRADPFGFFKLTQNGANGAAGVSLFVLPYNFPRLWVLLEELPAQMRQAPPPLWRSRMEAYLQGIPQYYIPPLRIALKRFGISMAVPDYMDSALPHPMLSFFKTLRLKAKAETDKIQLAIRQQQTPPPQQRPEQSPRVQPSHLPAENGARSFHALLDKASTSLYEPSPSSFGASQTPESDALGFSETQQGSQALVFRNAFDIPRSDLLRTVALLRGKLFFSPTMAADEAKHHVPIDVMGDYMEVLAKKQVLRPIDEEKERRNRKPLFGNPFRRVQQLVDEADTMDAAAGGGSGNSGGGRKRRRSILLAAMTAQQTPPAKAARHEERFNAFQANNAIRLQLYREVRRLNASHRNAIDTHPLASLLLQLKGDAAMKAEVLGELKEQARLFGSKKAIDFLESWSTQ